jgi:hypothetical protein
MVTVAMSPSDKSGEGLTETMGSGSRGAAGVKSHRCRDLLHAHDARNHSTVDERLVLVVLKRGGYRHRDGGGRVVELDRVRDHEVHT